MLVVGLVLVFPSTSNKKAGRLAYKAEDLAAYAKAKLVKSQLNKSNLRFEYDPSQEAAQRRSTVAQAILCPSCGVALGIPDVRPIKVTCPQCLQETEFNA